MTAGPADVTSKTFSRPALTRLTLAEQRSMQIFQPMTTELALIDLMFDRGAKKAFETATALAGQMHNSRFAWLTEINARALDGRPCIQPGFTPSSVSVHDAEYAKLSMSLPYYGFVATTVEGHDLVLYSANDDNVARVYFYYGPNTYETLSMRIWHRLSRNVECIYDIGALTGIYSIVAKNANKNCKCVAFEAMPHIRDRANMNIVLNGLTGMIEVEGYVISNSAQKEMLYTSTIMDSDDSIAARAQDKSLTSDLIQTITLDNYLSQPQKQAPELIKINVGLHAVSALNGAQNLLKTTRPSMLIEVSKNETFERVLSILHGFDYQIFSVDDYKLRLFEYRKDQSDYKNFDETVGDVHNIIACPNEEVAEIVRNLA